ncbi:MAG: DUF6247 family protein [Sporichthyaceae bacterium]
MTAQPAFDEPGPDDPAQILRILPAEFHAQFRSEYADAVEKARRPEAYAALAELLRLWHLRALAYTDPEYADRLAAVRACDLSGDVPLQQLIGERRQA